VGDLRRDARVALGAVAEVLGDAPAAGDGEALTDTPEPGDRVFVVPFQAEGIVRSVSGKLIEVEVRGMRTRAKVADLRQPGTQADAGRAGRLPRHGGGGGYAGSKDPAYGKGASQRVQVNAAPREGISARELVLIGSTVDQAIDRASKFLDDALMADEHRLRVVHGFGTGKLREALTRYFREHPLVASVSPASDQEGGGAATIVELKE
jgi:DNA mismatch repair protein MutS2